MQLTVSNCFLMLLGLCWLHPAYAMESSGNSSSPVIGAVVLNGVTVFSPEEQFSAYAQSLGQSRSSILDRQLIARVKTLYERTGYFEPLVTINRAASVTNQGLQVLHLDVLEARVAAVRIENLTEYERIGSAAVIRQFQSESGPLSHAMLAALEELLEAELDVELRLLTRPARTAGRYDLILVPEPTLSGELIYSTEGSPELGRQMFGVGLNFEHPFAGLRDFYLTGLHTIETDGYGNFGGGLAFVAGNSGSLELDANVSRVIEINRAEGLPRYRKRWMRLQYVHTLEESDLTETTFTMGITARNYSREEFGLDTLDEQLRLIGLAGRRFWAEGELAQRLKLGLRFGVDALGARRHDLLADADGSDDVDITFGLATADYTLWRSLPLGFSMKVDLGGQYSADELPFSQRFFMGGGDFFSAYESGEFSGDSGIGTRLELRRGYDTNLISGGRLVPYGYYGISTAYEHESESSESAAGAGLGLRVIANDFDAFIEFGKPLTAESEYREKKWRASSRISYYF